MPLVDNLQIKNLKVMNYCSKCGSDNITKLVPKDDHRLRDVCNNCNEIFYTNPRIVVGTIAIYNNMILLAKRGIEPMKGKWNLPAGFLEVDETLENGAIRETIEETRANVANVELHTIYQAKSNHLYVFYSANLIDTHFQETPESAEVKLFNFNEIPWNEIAFTSNAFAIKSFFEEKEKKEVSFLSE